MKIYPAIDIKDRKCVRLKQGKADECTVYFENPYDAAKSWVNLGASSLHIVDLDGAFEKEVKNLDIALKIKKDTGVFVEFGGGVRTALDIQKIIEGNIDRVILGTLAFKDPELIKWAALKYKEKIAVSVDCIDGKAAFNGWMGISEISLEEFVRSIINMGINTIIYTDIKRDGMLTGPDLSGIRKIINEFRINLIASGGITTIDDLKALKKEGVCGAVIGRALYSGKIRIEDALEVEHAF